MTMLDAVIIPNSFDFNVYIRKSKYLVSITLEARCFFMERKISSSGFFNWLLMIYSIFCTTKVSPKRDHQVLKIVVVSGKTTIL